MARALLVAALALGCVAAPVGPEVASVAKTIVHEASTGSLFVTDTNLLGLSEAYEKTVYHTYCGPRAGLVVLAVDPIARFLKERESSVILSVEATPGRFYANSVHLQGSLSHIDHDSVHELDIEECFARKNPAAVADFPSINAKAFWTRFDVSTVVLGDESHTTLSADQFRGAPLIRGLVVQDTN